ncbi:hypothetical protein [Acetanaerobacterium elongatum]|uniref:Uncharacterized protein n=1 Tax=Acetanaerobacterium elongatum TaxID=258515 RepID=A0A1H0G6V0_9FIRM|nr:hypothetical protein [Acetanaerobacterium elongatum]SDO02580.1 hypothetical protein SAMN05192585_1487 [Acetanaerobacterium elongatum]
MSDKKTAPVKKDKPLMYRGRPLVRSGDTIYYGSPSEKYMVKLEVIENKQINGEDTASRVTVNLISVDAGGQRTIKRGEKSGVFDALDIGGIWLERTLSEQKAKS